MQLGSVPSGSLMVKHWEISCNLNLRGVSCRYGKYGCLSFNPLGVNMKNKTSLKQKFFRSILNGALIAGLYPASNAFAALPPFPSNGSCAMLAMQVLPAGKRSRSIAKVTTYLLLLTLPALQAALWT